MNYSNFSFAGASLIETFCYQVRDFNLCAWIACWDADNFSCTRRYTVFFDAVLSTSQLLFYNCKQNPGMSNFFHWYWCITNFCIFLSITFLNVHIRKGYLFVMLWGVLYTSHIWLGRNMELLDLVKDYAEGVSIKDAAMSPKRFPL